ncbi:MAG: protease modulator HflC [SAR202 cluster bacterium]|nr:protease modulator HflC [SAR202 cluster bacterium]
MPRFRVAAITFVILVILTGILGPQSFFVVDQTKVALVTRFGEPKRAILEPGLYAKTPFVDTVTYYERRLALFDAAPDALLTADKKRLIIDVYAIGRITDPLRFRETVQDTQRAVTRSTDIIASDLRQEIALDQQSEIIRLNREAIMNRVRDVSRPKVQDFGVEIVDVRISRADFPNEIATSIYARMEAERKRIADAERSEGDKRDLEIRAGVDRQATIIRAEAERDANLLRGEGEADAIAIFASALEQDPEFYAFQRSLEAYQKFLTQNATVVLPADTDLFKFLQSPGLSTMNGATDSTDGGRFASDSEGFAVTEAARALLAADLGTDPQAPFLVGFEAVDWPDSSLGCPKEGESYAEVVVPGYRIVLEHEGAQYEFHSTQKGEQLLRCDA